MNDGTAARRNLNVLLETCGTCGGSGSMFDAFITALVSCPSCHGRGTVYPAELVEAMKEAIGNELFGAWLRGTKTVPYSDEQVAEIVGFILDALNDFAGGQTGEGNVIRETVVKAHAWWVERENGERLAGPFTTRDDAWRARDWVERALKPETFWLRDHPIANRGGNDG